MTPADVGARPGDAAVGGGKAAAARSRAATAADEAMRQQALNGSDSDEGWPGLDDDDSDSEGGEDEGSDDGGEGDEGESDEMGMMMSDGEGGEMEEGESESFSDIEMCEGEEGLESGDFSDDDDDEAQSGDEGESGSGEGEESDEGEEEGSGDDEDGVPMAVPLSSSGRQPAGQPAGAKGAAAVAKTAAAGAVGAGERYIPPALRARMLLEAGGNGSAVAVDSGSKGKGAAADPRSEEKLRLERRLTGLLNRLAESNLQVGCWTDSLGSQRFWLLLKFVKTNGQWTNGF